MNLLNLITFGGIMHAYIKESVLQLIVLGYLYSETTIKFRQAGRTTQVIIIRSGNVQVRVIK